MIVNVRDYGAIGDGVTDDTQAIQKALDDNYRGGDIMFPPGVYKVTKHLRYYSHQRLIGFYSRILRGSSSLNCLLLNANSSYNGGYTSVENIEIRGIIFDSNEEYDTSATLVSAGHGQNINIKDCIFENQSGGWHAIEINGCQYATIDSCIFRKVKTKYTNAEMIQIDGMKDSAGYPWSPCKYDGTVCKDVKIINCVFEGNDFSPAIGNHTDMAHDTIIIKNNIFKNFKGSRGAVNFTASCKNLIIQDNVIKDSPTGFVGSGEKETVITGNFFKGVPAMHAKGTFRHNYVSGAWMDQLPTTVEHY